VLLLKRPGELLRRADLLLRAGDADAAVSALEPTAAICAAPRDGCLEGTQRALPGPRVAIPKGQASRATVLEDRRAPIAVETLSRTRPSRRGLGIGWRRCCY